jgi:hypothetical protein
MRLSRLLSVSLAAIGASFAARVLQRRHQWEQTHNRVAICVDYDDAYTAAIRAGMSFDELLHELHHHGATHLSLPELTLDRLLKAGQLAPRASARPIPTASRAAPRVGHWNYLHGSPDLIIQLASELLARLPYTEAQLVDGDTLAFAGDLPTIGEIGLGFDATLAYRIASNGLHAVPRPVSYAWPEDRLIYLTLAQAAVFGKYVAFDGDMILGHELHLEATLDAMARSNLSLVYFAESRHQKGDWFVAKRRAPKVVLAHRFTPAEMIPLDFHAAAHHWAWLARERGIRFCYVNFFKVLHATDPRECLHYVEHIKEALKGDGFVVCADPALPTPVPAPDKQDLALTGMASAGAASAAVASALNLPDSVALPLTAMAAAGAVALPYLERARGHLEEQYPPSYAPKLLALGASLAPVALQVSDPLDWATGAAIQVGAGAAMAAATSGQDYHLRIEEYKGFNLDWLLPLASAASTIPDRTLRIGALAGLAGLWAICHQRNIDLLAKFDPAHAEGHTHHLSAAARLIGDARIVLGPQPARKWAGAGLAASALSAALASRGHKDWASAMGMLSALGGALGLAGWRRPERALRVIIKESLSSVGVGVVVGLLSLLFVGKRPEGER